jgi:hypothetical protein
MLKSKKLMSGVLAVIMLVSATSCSLGKPNPEEVIKAAETFAKATAAMDSKKMIKNIDDMDDDDAGELKEKFESIKDTSVDGNRIKQAIADTITYEVDEDSVEIKKDTATCEVVFKMTDYADATGDLAGAEDEFIEVISSTKKTRKYDVTLELVKSDDKWLVTADSVKELDDLFSFIDHKFDIVNNAGSLVDETEWFSCDNGVYENAYFIELDLWFVSHPDIKVYFNVSYNGSEIYKGSPIEVEGVYFPAYFDDSMGAPLTGYYISAGTYTITIYSEDGEVLANESCTVKVTDTVTTTTTGTTSTFEGEDRSFIISDRSFADLKNVCWWDYGYEDADGNWHKYMPDGDIYCIDAETIAFSVELNSMGPQVFYAYYFLPGENPSIDDLDPNSPVYTDTVSPTQYPDGTIFYDFDYTPDHLEVGVYVLVICQNSSSINRPYITAMCMVADITSDQIA